MLVLMLFRPQGTQNTWVLHTLSLCPQCIRSLCPSISLRPSQPPYSGWHHVCQEGRVLTGWNECLVSLWEWLGPWQPSGTTMLSACPLHPSSLLLFPRDSWTKYCQGHDLSEWLKGCDMHAKPNTKRKTSWFIPRERDFLSFVDLIKNGIYKQCQRPLIPDALHFPNAWRYSYSITSTYSKI